MDLRIDAEGGALAFRAAMAAGEKERPLAHFREQGGDGEGGRRLAVASEGRAADHDRRPIGARARRLIRAEAAPP